jgi:hypothetical protein
MAGIMHVLLQCCAHGIPLAVILKGSHADLQTIELFPLLMKTTSRHCFE